VAFVNDVPKVTPAPPINGIAELKYSISPRFSPQVCSFKCKQGKKKLGLLLSHLIFLRGRQQA